jgi:hypothetical protein
MITTSDPSAEREDALPTDGRAPGARTWRAALPAAAVIAGFLVLGLVAFWPSLPKISTHTFGAQGDFSEAVWFFGWPVHAVTHGLDPFWSDALNVPLGVNLGQNTEAPMLGLLGAPFTLAFSPLVATNLLLLLGMPLSATAAFVVLRKWKVWLPAAAIGGLVYGFSPYMLGQSEGHPQLMFQPWPPLIAYVVACILQGRGNPRRLGLALGLLVTAQYLTSPEVLALVVIFGVLAGLLVAARDAKGFPDMARAALLPVGIALVVSVVLLAYPVWMLLAGPQHAKGPTFPITNPFRNDLLSFVIPGPLQANSLGIPARVLRRILFYNNSTEAGGYIGIPLLLFAGFFAWRSRRSPRMQLSLALFFVAAILSLGPKLMLDGSLREIPLPYALLHELPLVNNILPSRFNFLVATFLGAIIAFGLDDLRRSMVAQTPVTTARSNVRRRRASIAVAVAVLVALVVTHWPRWPYANHRVDQLPAAITRAIPDGNPITMTYPYSTAHVVSPMVWQAMDGFSFRIFGGYAYIRGENGEGTVLQPRTEPADFQQFITAQMGAEYLGPKLPLTPKLEKSFRTWVSKFDMRMAIVDRSTRGSAKVVRLFTEVLGQPTVTSGDFLLWVIDDPDDL